MDTFDTILDGSLPSGVYRYAGRRSSTDLLRRAESAGVQGWLINGASVASKAEFLRAAATSMRLPQYVGHNWDAFEEVLTDLSWQPANGYLLIVENPARFAHSAPRDWRTLLHILADAVSYWEQRDRTLHVLLRRTEGCASDVRLLL